MEAPLNVKAAINLSDDFQRNGRPCFKLMPTLVGSDTAPDLDRPGLTNRSDEVHALHTAPTLLADAFCATCLAAIAGRSEEHTSELQSLMRISYAVFCLKKKQRKEISNIVYEQVNALRKHTHYINEIRK